MLIRLNANDSQLDNDAEMITVIIFDLQVSSSRDELCAMGVPECRFRTAILSIFLANFCMINRQLVLLFIAVVL